MKPATFVHIVIVRLVYYECLGNVGSVLAPFGRSGVRAVPSPSYLAAMVSWLLELGR